jgi:polygalacturonase
MIFYDVTIYGAKGDEVADDTEAIQAAIENCEANGGGTVYFPAGTYLTGPINLKSNMTLYVDAGATIMFRDDFDIYPAVKTRWSGYECYGFSPLIFGDGLKNVTIKGEGCFDGQGDAWWKVNRRLRKGEKYSTVRTNEIGKLNQELIGPLNTNLVEWESQFLRPPLLQFINCEHVTLEGITLQNSPFWNTHLVYCNDVSVRGVTFKNPSNTPNGDGFDIDSCSNVRISDCHFDVGDDCLCLKSGINEDGRRVGRPTENVTVTNCTMLHGHGGVVFGSENSGGIRNVTVSNCVFIGTDRGIRIKTNRARGAYIKNILVNNIYMEDVFCPLAINSFYRHGVDETDQSINSLEAIPVSEKTPVIEHIQISNVTAKNCRAAAAFIYGLPEMPVKDVSLRNITFEMTNDPEEPGGEPDMVKEGIFMAGDGVFCKYVSGMELDRLRIETRQGPAVKMEEVSDVEINSLTMKQVHKNTPIIQLIKVKDVSVDGRQARVMSDSYIHVDEDSKKNVFICGNPYKITV